MSIKHTSLDNLSKILDKDYNLLLGNSFYQNLLSEIDKELHLKYSAIYFLDDVSLSKKASVSNFSDSDIVDDIFLNDAEVNLLKLLNSKDDKTFLLKYDEICDFLINKERFSGFQFLFSKLMIKNSFFGFAVFIKNTPFNKDEISYLNLALNIYSYVIKDYELNNVLKTQLSILQDVISEKDDANKIIKKQNAKLIASDNAKTSFLANISHELRTPLNAIIGFSDVLIKEVFGKLNKKQTEYIKDINLASIHLMGLINSILDFSKIESGSMKLNLSNFSPEICVNEVINLLSSLLEAKEIKLSYENTYKATLCADYQKFQQILFNLVGNAIKFSNQKGKIFVRTKQDGEYFVLEVEDFGIGIEKKYHNFIFKKFTQIDNIYTKTTASTGLGLAITKEYVKLHKGKIYVVSKLGTGSTFVVKLKNK